MGDLFVVQIVFKVWIGFSAVVGVDGRLVLVLHFRGSGGSFGFPRGVVRARDLSFPSMRFLV